MSINEYYEMITHRLLFFLYLGNMYYYNDKIDEIQSVDEIMHKLYILANEEIYNDHKTYLPIFKKLIPFQIEKDKLFSYYNENTEVIKKLLIKFNSPVSFEVLKNSVSASDNQHMANIAIDYYYRFCPQNDEELSI